MGFGVDDAAALGMSVSGIPQIVCDEGLASGNTSSEASMEMSGFGVTSLESELARLNFNGKLLSRIKR
jgi:hypothetical protein